MLIRGMYFDPGSEGNGGSGSGDGGAQGFQNLVTRQGSADAAGILLYQENRTLRSEKRDLQAEIERLKKKVPGKEAVVLTVEQAQTWQAYQALGTPDEITAAQTDAKKFERQISVTNAAAAASYNTDVLLHLAPESAQFSVKQVQDADGNDVQSAYIKVGEGDEVELARYAEENWKPFLPSLATEGNQQQPQGGRTFIKQQGGQQPPKDKALTPEERVAKVRGRNRNYHSL